ncbi:MAG: response regulator transcription factor [Clostridium sp.]|uniref:response regulator transcription factor n=1 Tax=Clostridium sp. TaxID=1506 RepID=UPI0030271429
MDSKKILVVDDNKEIREVVGVLLGSEGYDVIEAVDGEDAISKINNSIDLIILDVMMPGKSGFEACVEIRKTTAAPILFLTAKTHDSDKCMGFSSGGDDYLSKPFSYTELISRVKALIRRYYVYKGKDIAKADDCIVIGDLSINMNLNEVYKSNQEVILTSIEYEMLLMMAKNRRKIFSAQNIYENIWKEAYFYTSNNTIMVHIRNLRLKLEDNPQSPKYIKTVWGKGYCIE